MVHWFWCNAFNPAKGTGFDRKIPKCTLIDSRYQYLLLHALFLYVYFYNFALKHVLRQEHICERPQLFLGIISQSPSILSANNFCMAAQ